MKIKEKNDNLPAMTWKFFASVKLSVFVLLALAVTSIMGTVVPQNGDPEMYHRIYGHTLYRVLDAVDAFDMYHCWWFRALLCLLMANIIICSIDRLSSTWRIIFPDRPVFHASRFKKAGNIVTWGVDGRPGGIRDAFMPYIERRYSYSRVESQDNGFVIFAEKGRWTRFGVYAVHLSVVLMVAGGLIGSWFGFEGRVNIPEGESVSSVQLKDGAEKPLGFALRCDKFTETRYDTGAPKDYRSAVSIIESGKVVVTKDIRVNDPLRHQGVRIFQSSYGKLPAKQFTVVFVDNASGLSFEKQGAFGDPIALPAGKGSLVVEKYVDSTPFHGHDLGPSFLCRLMKKGADPAMVILPVSFSSFDKMRGGEYAISIKQGEFRYYTGFQITRDPGVPVVYAGFVLMIIGCYITFFMFHKKICIQLSDNLGRVEVSVSALAGKNRPVPKTVINRLVMRLKAISRAQQHI